MKKPAKLYLETIGMIKLRDILEASNSTDSPGTKGYSGFTDASMWDKYKKFLEKIIEKTTGYTLVETKNLLIERGTLSIFDFDDTLAKSDSWVYVTIGGREVDKLDPAEFAVHTLEKGQEYDFKDFDRKLRNPKLIKRNVDLLRKQLSKGGRKVTILTARRLGAPINHFFKTIGIQPYVVPLGSADPQKKADWIEAEILKGYDPIYFMDDSPKNIKAVNVLKTKYPDVKLVTKLVKPI